jgi:hypothetical protein
MRHRNEYRQEQDKVTVEGNVKPCPGSSGWSLVAWPLSRKLPWDLFHAISNGLKISCEARMHEMLMAFRKRRMYRTEQELHMIKLLMSGIIRGMRDISAFRYKIDS